MKRLMAVLIALGFMVGSAAAETQPVGKTYRVRRGEVLTTIAVANKVGIDSMMLANESYLRDKYKDVCGELSRSFRKRKADRGTRKGGLFYCNDRFKHPYGNTLQPGWTLTVPSDTAPTSVREAVANIKGKRIALVIDDTGSMNDDRRRVGQFYLSALRQYGKRLTHVWLYADGRVRKYNGGNVEFRTSGGQENTFGALKEASTEKPDAIILITDEPGDDWNWSDVKSLPPVIGHCLADRGIAYCEENLRRLQRETKGVYMSGLK